MNNPRRLLLVDDSPHKLQTLYELFRDDYEVIIATDGPKALELCRGAEPPDLVLLDILMPDLDGLDICRILKASSDTADIPVIFLTASHDPDAETRALEAGGVDFICHPINPAVVRARVHTHMTLKAQSDALRAQIFTDGLTGIANRRRFDEALELEWRRERRSGKPLAIVMMDIDHFKLYNDHYGHQTGDACLAAVASTLERCLGRSHDLLARYGGEEFVALLPDCDVTSALAKAEEMRAAVQTLALRHAHSPTAPVVTISAGVASEIPGETRTPADLLGVADAALYAAKGSGRNRSVVGPDAR